VSVARIEFGLACDTCFEERVGSAVLVCARQRRIFFFFAASGTLTARPSHPLCDGKHGLKDLRDEGKNFFPSPALLAT
jgi:hypothetical protein